MCMATIRLLDDVMLMHLSYYSPKRELDSAVLTDRAADAGTTVEDL